MHVKYHLCTKTVYSNGFTEVNKVLIVDGQTCFENDYLEDEHCEKHEKMITTVISIIENIPVHPDGKRKYVMDKKYTIAVAGTG